MGLKAGWFRISNRLDIKIKSDQNGIESFLLFYQIPKLIYDKIRPKWDWKRPSWRRVYFEYLEIKSDQNGIESRRHCWIQESCRGRIKSDQNGIESSIFTHIHIVKCIDKIRPKWDWKHKASPEISLHQISIKSDQNGIESHKIMTVCNRLSYKIKSDQNGIERLEQRKLLPHSPADKIRPKWDWKLQEVHGLLAPKLKIKSDQNGIER